MKRKKIIIKIITLFILILSGDKLLSAADFSYIKILKEEYKFKAGTVVPVTIEQAIETDGDITRDGRYFFFTSDRDRGNFDIYLRDLSDIIYFKITGHASRDTSPAVSPDMKYLAFVSEREDPEGDIFTVKIDSKELIEEARESVTEIPTLDSGIKNISLFQDPVTKTIKIIKDASPCWSPDSKRIAFSSARDGLENIWIMDRDGDNKKQLTKKGGMYPRFSEDGNSIIYISYSESKNNGDVYIIDIASLGEKQITKTDDIELYPSFMGNSDEIIYTLINRDTNKDGKIDLKDNSIIFYKNLKTGMEYPLTSYSESSFSPKWSQALNLKDLFSGVIIFSNQVERNININLIPDFGIIPIRESDGARKQYELAEKYLYEYDDRERYLLALEKIYHIFGEKNDIESKIYVSRGLVEAAKQYKSAGSAKDVERIVSIISSISKNEYDYSSISARYLTEILKGGDGALIINKAIAALSEDSKLNSYVPYLMEELGNEYIRSGRPAEAIRTYGNIIKKYSDYKRIIYIHDKLISLTYTSLKDDLTPSHIALFESTYYTLIFDNYNKLIAIFESERNTRKRMSLLEGMLKKYDDKKSLLPLLYYEAGNTAFEMGNPALARKHINDSLKLLKDNNPLYYRANIILGRIEEQENNFPAMENNYYLAAINYKKWFRDPNYRAVVEKLISYYEEYGERADYSGDYKTSGKLYGHYVFVANYLNWLKIFNDIYNDSAPRAHVLYIDAYSNSVNNEIGAIQKLVGAYTDGNDYLRKLDQAIMDLNKAHMYGLGYLYSKIALACDTEAAGVVPDVTQLISSRQEDALKNFKTAVDQIQWALFMDDTFIDPEILRGWIYQYVDLKRKEDQEKNSGKNEKTFAKYFPKYLWEKNIAIYEKALETNDEGLYPETEGNLHLNLANSHFLLNNYPRAFTHYKLAEKHKAGFNSKIEEALFYYHLGYCYWQNSEIEDAKNRMSLTLDIYRSLSSGKGKKYKQQIYYIYKFFALFERTMKNYREAITWYNRIIDFASSNKINLDRARYYQEMAYCYRELGETGTALSYLKKSDMFLEKAEVTPQKFPVTVGVFGLFSFPMPFFDLGIDGTLVGDSKINAELNALQKKLLNVSMEEEIFYSRGNLEKSVQCLNKKLDLLKEAKTKSEISSKIRALNNIGFCYYRMHKYKEAGEYFQKAWDYALDPEVNDLEGIFIAILNSTHLYTFMLENRITGPADPSAQVDALLKKIEDYKNSYEAARLKEENDKLKNEAEAKKREVTAGELNAVKDIVSSETAEKYFTLDIAAGILKFRKAEQMRESAGEKNNYSGERNITRSFAYYKFNKDLFDLYSEAEIGFENALAKAELRPSRKLQIKLLLNIAGCQKRTGQFAEAYSTYSSAEKLARQYEYNDLIWKTCYHTADFLVEFGEIAEGAGYLDIAEDYYKNATGIIEEFPFLYAGDISKIKKLFMEYTGLLVRKGNHEDAILNSESLYEISRLIHISLSSSEL
ncbi:MAG: hypothetical protein MUC95_04405, partial [Spirochaetes bacterium]|nr:hypothetical protein [Spirochaetota bacterium]